MKALILDLNGIVMLSEKLSVRFERDFHVAENVFIPELMKIMQDLRKPDALPAFSYWEPVLQKWGISFSEKEFWDYWFSAEKVNEDLIQYIKKLRQQDIKVFILSNNFKERAEYYKTYSWLGESFDKVYFSFQTGFVKPDKNAWLYLCQENNLKPSECVYFDDQEKNVEISNSVGLRSFLFQNTKDLIARVESEKSK